jgi:ppGpp synthetase/RelA/SpoT-type nucleotidyltranferase
MTDRTVEDRLREEYFSLLADARRTLDELETEVRHCLLPLSHKLDKHEKLAVTSRVKDCESALGALRRRQEGATFDPEKAAAYTLSSLNDLAGVRVLVFPRSRWEEANLILRQHPMFAAWATDPIRSTLGDANSELLAFKYYGFCSKNARVRAEIQIAPMLIGLFWEVEHSAIYKPSPRFKGVLAEPGMEERTTNVYSALRAFEEKFEELIRHNPLATS